MGALACKTNFNSVRLVDGQVDSVACGAAHTLVLTRNEITGKVKLFAFGLNDRR